jgi:hypothetical protein
MTGYSQSEIDDIQSTWKIRFPPDLAELLRQRRTLHEGRGAFDWIKTDPNVIQQRFDWPFEGFWFDVQNNSDWWPEWGEMPQALEDRYKRLRQVFDAAPKLIPLFAHRYLPEEPFEIGNPVLSVHQTDVICYGTNLHDWLARERDGWDRTPMASIKEIPFWSQALRKNNAELMM